MPTALAEAIMLSPAKRAKALTATTRTRAVAAGDLWPGADQLEVEPAVVACLPRPHLDEAVAAGAATRLENDAVDAKARKQWLLTRHRQRLEPTGRTARTAQWADIQTDWLVAASRIITEVVVTEVAHADPPPRFWGRCADARAAPTQGTYARAGDDSDSG